MAEVTQLGAQPNAAVARARSDIRFPARSLADSVAVAKAIHEKGGGKATPDALAAYLGYKSTENGAYLARVGAARTFNVINKTGDVFTLTPLAQQILMPTYPEQARAGLVEAFLNVELFRRVYEEFKGKELPPEFGMKNALRNTFKVVPTRVEVAYRVLMDSANDAGFFDTRGARTHLIMPSLQVTPPPPPGEAEAEREEPRGGGGGNDPPPPSSSQMSSGMAALRERYLESLIKLHEEKAAKGELDEALTAKIETLLLG